MMKNFANIILIIGLSLGATSTGFAQDRDRGGDKKEKPPEKIKENPKPNDNRDRGGNNDRRDDRPKKP
jgi:hypothetical protein